MKVDDKITYREFLDLTKALESNGQDYKSFDSVNDAISFIEKAIVIFQEKKTEVLKQEESLNYFLSKFKKIKMEEE